MAQTADGVLTALGLVRGRANHVEERAGNERVAPVHEEDQVFPAAWREGGGGRARRPWRKTKPRPKNRGVGMVG